MIPETAAVSPQQPEQTLSVVIFDLDGTISDPAGGITGCINHALVELGHPARPVHSLLQYIGPRLPHTFSELMGTEDATVISRAIELFRERYIETGYRENRAYDGMGEALAELHRDGWVLCVATAKRTDIAEQVLRYLRLDGLFSQVHGCDERRTKVDLLKNRLTDADTRDLPMVMVGDRASDFVAAAEVGMASIAVRWGYGSDSELSLATEVVDAPSHLPEAVRRTARRVTAHPQE
jgi:phosphoglycolate phosphatase